MSQQASGPNRLSVKGPLLPHTEDEAGFTEISPAVKSKSNDTEKQSSRNVSMKFSLASGSEWISTETGEATSLALPFEKEIYCVDYHPPPVDDSEHEMLWGEPKRR